MRHRPNLRRISLKGANECGVLGIDGSARTETFVTVLGVRTRVVCQGEGPTLMLMHGWGCNVETWAAIWPSLAQRYRLVAFDFPGFGQADEPRATEAGKAEAREAEGLVEPWGVPEYAVWTRALIKALDIAPCHVLAHSFGTRVMLVLAAESSELFGKLVLTGACGARLASKRRSARTRVYKALRGMATLFGKLFPKAGARWREALVQRFGSADYKVLGDAMRKVFVRVVNQDLREYLPRVAHETLLIWGDGDDAMPLEVGRIMEREMPAAGLAVFEGAGHFAFVDQPARFMRVMDAFL